MRRSWIRPAALLLAILPGLAACGGGGGSGPSAGTTFLIQHNAQFNDGRTVRWPTLPITVFLGGIANAAEVTAWTSATGGAVTFAFVGSAAAAGITIRGTSATDVCGVTNVVFSASGVITSADTALSTAIFRGPQCVRTVTHEMGHAIGFLDHTMDGGLMDADGGNGQFTMEVTQMISQLYSMPPGTFLGTEKRQLLLRPTEGRRSMRFVYYPRR